MIKLNDILSCVECDTVVRVLFPTNKEYQFSVGGREQSKQYGDYVVEGITPLQEGVMDVVLKREEYSIYCNTLNLESTFEKDDFEQLLDENLEIEFDNIRDELEESSFEDYKSTIYEELEKTNSVHVNGLVFSVVNKGVK